MTPLREPTMFDMVFRFKSCVRALTIIQWRIAFSKGASIYDATIADIHQQLHGLFDWFDKSHRATTAGAYTIQSTCVDLLFSTDARIVSRAERLLGEASIHSIDRDFMPRIVKLLASKDAVAMAVAANALNQVGFAQRNWPRGSPMKRANWAKLCYRYNIIKRLMSTPMTIHHRHIINDVHDAVKFCQTACILAGFHRDILAAFDAELAVYYKKIDETLHARPQEHSSNQP